MNLIIIHLTPGSFLAATSWERNNAKTLVMLHPATTMAKMFYKEFTGYLHDRGFIICLLLPQDRTLQVRRASRLYEHDVS